MPVIDDDEFDVARIDTDLLYVVHNFVDERFLGGVEHDVTLRRGQNPCGHEARTHMVEVIEDFERFYLLNLNLTRARTLAADLADRFTRRLGHHQIVTQRHDQTDRCHRQDVFHRCSSFYWADFAFASMLHERASSSRCLREPSSRRRSVEDATKDLWFVEQERAGGKGSLPIRH